MSLAIVGMPPCGFGNRLLYYYNLRQESYQRGCDFFCIPWEGHQLFEGNLLGIFNKSKHYKILEFCLGDKFYAYNNLSTREVFRIRNPPKVKEGTCAIHFRGTDFHAWNPNSILSPQYYCDSIDKIKNKVSNYIVFTDDVELESYKQVIKLLQRMGVDFSLGENSLNRTNYVKDFALMTECDWIISSPSTFCICAGFIGKQKKIIHSKRWVMDRVEKEDKFWTDLYNGGNNDYKLWEVM